MSVKLKSWKLGTGKRCFRRLAALDSCSSATEIILAPGDAILEFLWIESNWASKFPDCLWADVFGKLDFPELLYTADRSSVPRNFVDFFFWFEFGVRLPSRQLSLGLKKFALNEASILAYQRCRHRVLSLQAWLHLCVVRKLFSWRISESTCLVFHLYFPWQLHRHSAWPRRVPPWKSLVRHYWRC